MTPKSASAAVPGAPEPAWDVARLFPPQGVWSEEEFLRLPGNRVAELDDGRIEVLDRPSELHQLLVAYLYRALLDFVSGSGMGTVLFAPFPIKLWDGKLREPDLAFMRREHADRRHQSYWLGADLVMEVMSPDDPKRDSEVKKAEYARAGVPEYWLIEPLAETVTVLVLDGKADQYAVHGVFRKGQTAGSRELPGFAVDVQALFAAAN